MKRLFVEALKLAPWLTLGPVTGLGCRLCLHYCRANRPGMLFITAMGLCEWWSMLSGAEIWMLSKMGLHF